MQIFYYLATYRPIAKKQMCKQATVQQPLLENSYMDTLFPSKERTRNNKRDVFCAVRSGIYNED
jgi:hypothetical protein